MNEMMYDEMAQGDDKRRKQEMLARAMMGQAMQPAQTQYQGGQAVSNPFGPLAQLATGYMARGQG
jgi:hypothetical protein